MTRARTNYHGIHAHIVPSFRARNSCTRADYRHRYAIKPTLLLAAFRCAAYIMHAPRAHACAYVYAVQYTVTSRYRDRSIARRERGEKDMRKLNFKMVEGVTDGMGDWGLIWLVYDGDWNFPGWWGLEERCRYYSGCCWEYRGGRLDLIMVYCGIIETDGKELM